MPIDVLRADLGPGVRAGWTTRAGGGSRPPYDGLNLGLHVGDDSRAVAANRRLLAEEFGSPVRFARQVHGTQVLVVEPGEDEESWLGGDGPEADAVVSAGPGIAVGVLVADCVPVLIADAGAGVVGAVHAGRQGFGAGVVEAAVSAMAGLGAEPERMRSAVGPSAGGCCYEVPAVMRDELGAAHPAASSTTRRGTPSLDLRAGVAAALRAVGVAEVTLAGDCTIDDDALFSYRRAAVTGRFAGVVRAGG